jgi:hypothetical protein
MKGSARANPAMLPGSPIKVRWRGDASTVFGHGFLCPTAGFYFSEKWTEKEDVNDVNIVLRKLRTITTMRGAIFQIRHVLRVHNWAADKLSKGEPIHEVLTHARAEFPGHSFPQIPSRTTGVGN